MIREDTKQIGKNFELLREKLIPRRQISQAIPKELNSPLIYGSKVIQSELVPSSKTHLSTKSSKIRQ